MVVGVAVAAVLGLAATASAETLQNDGFVDGQAVAFQAGFVAGEQAAAVFTPSSANSWKLDNVQLLFGGASTTQTVTLHIYADTGADNPGAELFSADYQLTGANDALSEIDLSSDNILFTGDIRVSIELQHTGPPTFASDTDGSIAADRNYIEADGAVWVQSNLLLVTGDWVIRANATEQGGGGPVADAGPSSSVPDAGAGSDAGGSTGDSCALNSDCTNGSYCGDDSTCGFDCRVDIDCSGDSVCDEVGRCAEPESSDGGCNTSGSTPIGLLAGLFMSMLLFRRRRA